MASDAAPSAPPGFLHRHWKPLSICFALAMAVLVLYGQTCRSNFDFVNVDDPDYVSANPHVKEGLTSTNIAWAFTTFHAYNWHPLTWLSLQLDADLFGPSARGFHLTNMLLHAANAVLLFGILFRTTARIWLSAAVAALFAVHPTHVESVAWVTERKDVLSTFLWLLTMAAYAWYAAKPDWKRYLAVVVSFALGLMAKPMLVTLPAVLLLVDYWPLRRWQYKESVATPFARASLGRLVVEKLPLFAMVAALIPVTIRAQSTIVRTFEQISIRVRMENALVSYVQYLWMNFWPVKLAIFYPHPRTSVQLWQVVAAAALLIAVTVTVIWFARRRPSLAVGWFWYLGTLVPVIGLVQVGMQALADRYTYVPSIGFFIMVVWGIAAATESWTNRAKPVAIAAGVVLVLFSLLTWKQIRYWKDSETLWQHTLEVTKENGTAREYLGLALAAKQKYPEAERQLRQAMRLYPYSVAVRVNLAMVLERQGKLDEAAAQFAEAVNLDAATSLAHAGLGSIREQQGRYDDAERHYADALTVDPNSIDALNGMGNIRKRNGKFSEALQFYDRVVELQPQRAGGHNNRGVALEGLGKLTEAVKAYRQAVVLEPDDLLLRCNLAFAQYESGQTEAAARNYREAFRIDANWPRTALIESWMRSTHPDAKLRNGAQAIRTAKLVCQATEYRMPDSLDVLAAAYAENGQFDEAVLWQTKTIEMAKSLADTPAQILKDLEERLKLYKARKPFRQKEP